MFAAESGGLIFCSDSSDEKAVYASFREKYDAELRKVSDEAMVLFKVTVDDGSKVKVVVYAGVAHSSPFSQLVALCNEKFSKNAGQEGAFILKAGYGINPNKSAGVVFMKYGLELTFHTKVDFTRMAYAS